MSITAHWYTLALSEQYSGSPVNWTSDPLMCGLVTASYTLPRILTNIGQGLRLMRPLVQATPLVVFH